MKSRKYIIVDSKRFFIFITFIFVLLSLVISLIFTLPRAHSSIQKQNFEEYRVLNGDNLWNISLKYIPKDYDVRKMIFDIKELNNMETSCIYEGDIIKIPLHNK
jgi:uncharacterized protein YpuA (DUF1002 family)